MMDWFKHDIYCLQDDRLFTLVSRYGADGYAVFFHTVEAMYANDGNPIYEMAIRRIAFELSIPFDKVQSIIDFASSANCGHLFGVTEDGGYISVRVIKGVEEHENKRQHYSNMGKASAERRNSISSNVSSTQVERELNAGSTDKIRRDKKRKDITSLSKDSLVGGQQADAPAKNKEETDLFGDKVEGKRDSVPVQKIVEYWNEKVKSTALPQVTKLTNERRTAIKQRWKEYADDIYKVIDKTVASDFLTGRDGKWQMCDFDWVFQRKNTLKIIEGKYDEKDIKVSSKHTGNNRSFRPRDINGQYDNEELEELTEL